MEYIDDVHTSTISSPQVPLHLKLFPALTFITP